MNKTEFFPYPAKSILNKYKRPDSWFWIRYSAYPYIGCQHGCEFCYCREKKYAPYEDVSQFPYHIKVKENAPFLLRRALMKVPTDAIAIGDYQPAERRFELSRQMLAICAELNFPVFVLERSALVLRDMDLLESTNQQTYASVVFSIIHTAESAHAGIINRMEGLAPPPRERFQAMEALAKKGICTGTCFMPILPGLCDTAKNIDFVVHQTKEHGGQFVLAAPLTLADQQKAYFFNFLENHFPQFVPTYQAKYPPKSYVPTGNYRQKVGQLVRAACSKWGLPDRMPRPLIPGEKRALNKKIVQMLTDQIYTMELGDKPASQIWAYRKAAWAVEDLDQDISLVYRKMGRKGLQAIEAIGPSISLQLETFIQQQK